MSISNHLTGSNLSFLFPSVSGLLNMQEDTYSLLPVILVNVAVHREHSESKGKSVCVHRCVCLNPAKFVVCLI